LVAAWSVPSGGQSIDETGGTARGERSLVVLVVEDDAAIAEAMVAGLRHHGFVPHHVATGRDALDNTDVDVVVLDLGLPDIDGLDVCRTLRSSGHSMPIIVVSARGDEIDRVVGLEVGADDYLAKPFGMRELIARIRAVQRRILPRNETSITTPVHSTSPQESGGSDLVQLGTLVVDLRAHRVSLGGSDLELTAKEFGVLKLLAADPGAVVTRSALIEKVWDEHWYGPTKTLDVHVAQLRKKLGNPGWIETVRSVGYRLVDPFAE
jgi:two-component system, OmpR family, response regulator RegX3